MVAEPSHIISITIDWGWRKPELQMKALTKGVTQDWFHHTWLAETTVSGTAKRI